VDVEQSQVGVREATGHNDGKEVEAYLRYCGLKKGDPYCAAGQAWSHGQLNIPNPKSGYSPDWFRTNVVYRKDEFHMVPFKSRPGQVGGIYVESKGRIGHVVMIKQDLGNTYTTVEFNVGGSGNAGGEGVRNLIRKKSEISLIADYVGWKEYSAGMQKLNIKKLKKR
jgi:hypothetical protein